VGCDIEAMSAEEARRVGELAGRADHEDIVDVAVVEGAARREDDVILASNESHVRKISKQLEHPSASKASEHSGHLVEHVERPTQLLRVPGRAPYVARLVGQLIEWRRGRRMLCRHGWLYQRTYDVP
jgi:hypothetical protein